MNIKCGNEKVAQRSLLHETCELSIDHESTLCLCWALDTHVLTSTFEVIKGLIPRELRGFAIGFLDKFYICEV